MGLFDFIKKKKEPEYDVTNMKVTDLAEGFIFEYDLKSWVVKEVYQYDWGKNNFSKEYMIDAGDEVAYLSVAEEGELSLTVTKNVKIQKLGEGIRENISRTNKAPEIIKYDGEIYYLDEDSAGYFNDISKGTGDWEELTSFDYLDEEETKCLSITQWDDRNFDASAGVVIKEYEISNIVPGA
ncbi:MAG: DUF4178 domain-containing protein [Roseivirga sp.]|nr:DUF4178 domain-containing protein [Roseivirga sp.]